jgi:hypothetical protein
MDVEGLGKASGAKAEREIGSARRTDEKGTRSPGSAGAATVRGKALAGGRVRAGSVWRPYRQEATGDPASYSTTEAPGTFAESGWKADGSEPAGHREARVGADQESTTRDAATDSGRPRRPPDYHYQAAKGFSTSQRGHRASEEGPGTPPEEYLTGWEASRLLKLSPKTIRNKVSAGIFFKGVHFVEPRGSRRRWKRAALIAWLEGLEADKDVDLIRLADPGAWTVR